MEKLTYVHKNTFGCTKTFTTCAENYWQIYVVSINIIKCHKFIYMCTEIIEWLAWIFWLPTILGMLRCHNYVTDLVLACFSKITYIVTVCKYSKGLYGMGYCTFCDFLLWPTWVQFQSLTSFFISEIIDSQVCILLKIWQIAIKVCEIYPLSIYYWRMRHALKKKRIDFISMSFHQHALLHIKPQHRRLGQELRLTT